MRCNRLFAETTTGGEHYGPSGESGPDRHGRRASAAVRRPRQHDIDHPLRRSGFFRIPGSRYPVRLFFQAACAICPLNRRWSKRYRAVAWPQARPHETEPSTPTRKRHGMHLRKWPASRGDRAPARHPHDGLPLRSTANALLQDTERHAPSSNRRCRRRQCRTSAQTGRQRPERRRRGRRRSCHGVATGPERTPVAGRSLKARSR